MRRRGPRQASLLRDPRASKAGQALATVSAVIPGRWRREDLFDPLGVEGKRADRHMAMIGSFNDSSFASLTERIDLRDERRAIAGDKIGRDRVRHAAMNPAPHR